MRRDAETRFPAGLTGQPANPPAGCSSCLGHLLLSRTAWKDICASSVMPASRRTIDCPPDSSFQVRTLRSEPASYMRSHGRETAVKSSGLMLI